MVQQASGCLLCNPRLTVGASPSEASARHWEHKGPITGQWNGNRTGRKREWRRGQIHSGRQWEELDWRGVETPTQWCELQNIYEGGCPALFRPGFISIYTDSILSTNANPFNSIIIETSSDCTHRCQGFTVTVMRCWMSTQLYEKACTSEPQSVVRCMLYANYNFRNHTEGSSRALWELQTKSNSACITLGNIKASQWGLT